MSRRFEWLRFRKDYLVVKIPSSNQQNFGVAVAQSVFVSNVIEKGTANELIEIIFSGQRVELVEEENYSLLLGQLGKSLYFRENAVQFANLFVNQT